MVEHEPVTVEEDEIHYCEVHPDRETNLRCNKCGRYMCPQCAVQTPVGYRCRECIRAQDDKYFSATNNDYVIIFAICTVLSLVGGVIASAIHFGIFVMFIAIPFGGFIGEMALRAVQRRRGRYSVQVAAAGAVIGGALGKFVHIFLLTGILTFDPTFIVRDISTLVYIGIIAVTVSGMFKVRI
jgi:hypothetical protein